MWNCAQVQSFVIIFKGPPLRSSKAKYARAYLVARIVFDRPYHFQARHVNLAPFTQISFPSVSHCCGSLPYAHYGPRESKVVSIGGEVFKYIKHDGHCYVNESSVTV